MRRRRKKQNIRAKLGAVILAIIVILLIAAAIGAENAVKDTAVMQAEYYSRLKTNEIVGAAVSDYLSENQYTYSDFAAVLYGEDQKIVSIEAIAYNINKVQAELTLTINKRLEECGNTTAEIPVGSLTDSYLLAGKGPHISLRICPVRDASVTLTSTFTSAGMNQTCHRISAVVTTEVNSSIPLYSFETQTSFEFLLAESVIVGEIPQTALSVWSREN